MFSFLFLLLAGGVTAESLAVNAGELTLAVVGNTTWFGLANVSAGGGVAGACPDIDNSLLTVPRSVYDGQGRTLSHVDISIAVAGGLVIAGNESPLCPDDVNLYFLGLTNQGPGDGIYADSGVQFLRSIHVDHKARWGDSGFTTQTMAGAPGQLQLLVTGATTTFALTNAVTVASSLTAPALIATTSTQINAGATVQRRYERGFHVAFSSGGAIIFTTTGVNHRDVHMLRVFAACAMCSNTQCLEGSGGAGTLIRQATYETVISVLCSASHVSSTSAQAVAAYEPNGAVATFSAVVSSTGCDYTIKANFAATPATGTVTCGGSVAAWYGL